MRASGGFVAIALSTVALAGCLGPTETVDPLTIPSLPVALQNPALQCIQTLCNFLATVDPVTRQANELSIAVNPTDPRNIVATGKDYTPEYAGDCVWDGLYVTKDGGATWKNSNLPGSPWKRLRDPAEPVTEFSSFWCVTDPVLAFGPDGTLYWTVMPYQCDAASGSKTGRGVFPQVPGTFFGGGLNDWAFTCSAMYVLVSEDGGETWPIVREVAFGPLLMHDKQWIAASPDGKTVLLCWDWNLAYVVHAEMVCSVSKDKGRSWSDYASVNPNYDGYYPFMDFDSDGIAYMAFQDRSSIYVARSADGLSWEAPTRVGAHKMPPPGGEHGRSVLANSEFRVAAMPQLAVDRSVGPHGGNVYVTWFDHSSGFGRTLFARSTDGGQTFSEPVIVRDLPEDHPSDQFFPAISVGPDGVVDLSWHDRRDDPANYVYDLYYAYSRDGGLTWSANLRVTEVSSDERFSRHQNGMVFLGDYRASASSAGAAHLVWTDTRNGKADVFVATVER
ncbi:MAG TPA: sialidase family protein [Candidatus Thermoplasmatota archaeon]|nr:sialidase family protein [Candidatus Thermoplasmatota archaeon]